MTSGHSSRSAALASAQTSVTVQVPTTSPPQAEKPQSSVTTPLKRTTNLVKWATSALSEPSALTVVARFCQVSLLSSSQAMRASSSAPGVPTEGKVSIAGSLNVVPSGPKS